MPSESILSESQLWPEKQFSWQQFSWSFSNCLYLNELIIHNSISSLTSEPLIVTKAAPAIKLHMCWSLRLHPSPNLRFLHDFPKPQVMTHGYNLRRLRQENYRKSEAILDDSLDHRVKKTEKLTEKQFELHWEPLKPEVHSPMKYFVEF